MTATSLLMIPAFVVCLVAMELDPRTITGVSAWLKPAKFAISSAIFGITMVWIYGYLDLSKTLRCVGDILAAVLILEVGIIDIQAFRGTTSHFNFATPLDGALFGIMGVAIGVLWVATLVVCVAAFRQRFANPAFGLSLKLGLLLTVIGSAAGGLMLRTTPEQSLQRQMHQQVTANGGHTVGAPDGGPGLPGVGWSTEHGDLRIPHFLGLHALQILPFVAWIVGRRRRATALVFTAFGSYLAFFAILTWQALRGESIAQPSSLTLAALGLWIVVTIAVAALTMIPAANHHAPAAGAAS